jgi:hypothetical protein
MPTSASRIPGQDHRKSGREREGCRRTKGGGGECRSTKDGKNVNNDYNSNNNSWLPSTAVVAGLIAIIIINLQFEATAVFTAVVVPLVPPSMAGTKLMFHGVANEVVGNRMLERDPTIEEGRPAGTAGWHGVTTTEDLAPGEGGLHGD